MRRRRRVRRGEGEEDTPAAREVGRELGRGEEGGGGGGGRGGEGGG